MRNYCIMFHTNIAKVTQIESKILEIVKLCDHTQLTWEPFLKEVRRNFDYRAGIQLDPSDIAYIESKKRHPWEFNFINSLIQAAYGSMIQNRVKMKAVGYEPNDNQKAYIATMLLDFFQNKTDVVHKRAQAALHAMVGRIGYTELEWLPTHQFPEGQIVRTVHDPFTVYGDPFCTSDSFDDGARFVFVLRYMSPEVLKRFTDDPAIKKVIDANAEAYGLKRNQLAANSLIWTPFRYGADERAGFNGADMAQWTGKDNKTFLTAKYYEKRFVVSKFFVNPVSGSKREIPYDNQKNDTWIREELERLRISDQRWDVGEDEEGEQIWCTIINPILCPDTPVWEAPTIVQGHGFPVKDLRFDRGEPDIRKIKSLVDPEIHPQDAYNKLQNTIYDLIVRARNPSYIIQHGAVREEDMDAWQSDETGIPKRYNPNQPKPEREDVPGNVASLIQLVTHDLKYGKRPSGMNENFVGTKETSNETGKLFTARVAQGQGQLAGFQENVNDFDKSCAEYEMELLKARLRKTTIVRITGIDEKKNYMGMRGVEMKNGEAYMTVNGYDSVTDEWYNDIKDLRYDIEIDSTAYTTVAKQANAEEGVRILKTITHPYAYLKMLALTLKNLDFPDVGETIEALNQAAEWELNKQQSASVMAQVQMKAAIDSITQKMNEMNNSQPAPAGLPPGQNLIN